MNRGRSLKYAYQVLLPLLLSLGSALSVPSPAGAEFRALPSLALSEEYNDNIFEVAGGARSDLISRVQPGVGATYQGKRLQGDLIYFLDYRKYARHSRDDEFNHNLLLTSHLELIDNFFFLDLADSLSRVSLNVTRPNTQESTTFVNQTDQNSANVSPYFLWRLGEHGALKTGYRYGDTRYWSATAVDKRDNMVFAAYSYALTDRLVLSSDYSFDHVVSTDGNYNRQDLSGGFRYEYAAKSFIFGTFGNSWQQFYNGNFSNPFWYAGITNDFGVVVGSLETRVQFTEDPLTLSTKETSYNARIERPFSRGLMGAFASYAEYLPTQSATGRHQISAGANGHYEFSPKFTGTFSLLGDRLTSTDPSDFPYHFDASAGLNYVCNYGITLAATYNYVSYRLRLRSDTGAKVIDRVVIEARKVF